MALFSLNSKLSVAASSFFDLLLQQIAFKNLVQRNRQTEQQANRPPPPNSIIHLPFIIVNTSKKTVIDCSISNDKYVTAQAFMFNTFIWKVVFLQGSRPLDSYKKNSVVMETSEMTYDLTALYCRNSRNTLTICPRSPVFWRKVVWVKTHYY